MASITCLILLHIFIVPFFILCPVTEMVPVMNPGCSCTILFSSCRFEFYMYNIRIGFAMIFYELINKSNWSFAALPHMSDQFKRHGLRMWTSGKTIFQFRPIFFK